MNASKGQDRADLAFAEAGSAAQQRAPSGGCHQPPPTSKASVSSHAPAALQGCFGSGAYKDEACMVDGCMRRAGRGRPGTCRSRLSCSAESPFRWLLPTTSEASVSSPEAARSSSRTCAGPPPKPPNWVSMMATLLARATLMTFTPSGALRPFLPPGAGFRIQNSNPTCNGGSSVRFCVLLSCNAKRPKLGKLWTQVSTE